VNNSGGFLRPSVVRLLMVGVAVLMSASMWRYFDSVLIPYQAKQAVTQHTPRGNLSDLYPRWLGTRELLLHGRDPYSADVTREIQIGYYGEALDKSNPDSPKDEQRFAYPAYVVFLLAPTITVPFPTLRAVFRILLILMTAASVPLWMRALGLKFERSTTAVVALLMLGSFPVVLALHLEQLSLLVFFLIAAACAAIAAKKYTLAGILLAIATIKPQVAVALVAWFLLWALGDWTRRRRLMWSFSSSMALLCLGAEAILPGWFGRWWTAMHAYLGYNDARSLVEILLGRYAGLTASALIAAAVVCLCWRARRAPAGSHAFGTCLMSVLAASLLIKPKFPLYDVALLLPVALWLIACRKSLWERSRLTRDLFFCASVIVGWQWIFAAALAAIALVFTPAAQRGWQLPGIAMFLLPVGLFCPLAALAVELWRTDALNRSSGSLEHNELIVT
jgi:hypothetical protein